MDPITLDVEVQYETRRYWAIFKTSGNQDPRFVKTEPTGLEYNEIALAMEIKIPKARKKMIQTVVIKMPPLDAHVANIEVAVPEVTA